MNPKTVNLYDVSDATWPAAGFRAHGPWVLRDGQGGGKRVSAATACAPVHDQDIAEAEAQMRAQGQTPLFQIRQGDDALDAGLAARGYEVVDPVNLWLAPVDQIATQSPPPVTAFAVWEPLAIQLDIWAKGGIGPGRIAVMERVKGAKTTIFGRIDDKPAASGFVAIHQGVAMIHAIEVAAQHRRKGMARWLLRKAGFWAQDQGATHLSVICTRQNTAANALYSSLGMSHAGHYHYRKHKDELT